MFIRLVASAEQDPILLIKVVRQFLSKDCLTAEEKIFTFTLLMIRKYMPVEVVEDVVEMVEMVEIKDERVIIDLDVQQNRHYPLVQIIYFKLQDLERVIFIRRGEMVKGI